MFRRQSTKKEKISHGWPPLGSEQACQAFPLEVHVHQVRPTETQEDRGPHLFCLTFPCSIPGPHTRVLLAVQTGLSSRTQTFLSTRPREASASRTIHGSRA